MEGIDFKRWSWMRESGLFIKNISAPEGKIIHGSFLEMEKPFAGKFTLWKFSLITFSTRSCLKYWNGKKMLMYAGNVQKEVAQRVAAKEGSKSVWGDQCVGAGFFGVEYCLTYLKNVFQPPPKVRAG